MHKVLHVPGTALFLLASLLAGCSEAPEAAEASLADELLIRDARIVFPVNAEVSPPLDLLIRNGRIARIAADIAPNRIRPPRVIEAAGRFLTPGLIDSHTHLNGVPGMTFQQMDANPDLVRAAMDQLPRSYLYFGFTSVVDLNSTSISIAEWNRLPVRPTAYHCGAAPLLGGYPTQNIAEDIRHQVLPFFLVEDDATDLPEDLKRRLHTPEAAARQIKQDGSVCVKTHYEPGFSGSTLWPNPSLPLIRRLAEAAHSQQLPLVIHASSQQAQQFAVDAGADAIAHGLWNWNNNATTRVGGSITELLNRIISDNIAWQPTIQVLYGERDQFDPDYLNQPVLRHVLPASLIAWYRSDAGQQFRRSIAVRPSVLNLLAANNWEAIDQDAIARVMNSLTYLAANNALLLFGSDTPSDQTYANPPGLNGYMEMQRWRDAGVSPAQFLKAATISNARFFGLDAELGSVETGKQADLLLLNEDPTLSFAAWDSISTIIVDGEVYTRGELSALSLH